MTQVYTEHNTKAASFNSSTLILEIYKEREQGTVRSEEVVKTSNLLGYCPGYSVGISLQKTTSNEPSIFENSTEQFNG